MSKEMKLLIESFQNFLQKEESDNRQLKIDKMKSLGFQATAPGDEIVFKFPTVKTKIAIIETIVKCDKNMSQFHFNSVIIKNYEVTDEPHQYESEVFRNYVEAVGEPFFAIAQEHPRGAQISRTEDDFEEFFDSLKKLVQTLRNMD